MLTPVSSPSTCGRLMLLVLRLRNHLSGSLIQTDWSEDGSGSWEIPAFASQALVGDNGDRVGPENRLDLDGVTFAAPPASQVLNFFASGSDIISNSALCPLVAGHDFSDKNALTPVVKIEEIWNENEFKLEPAVVPASWRSPN